MSQSFRIFSPVVTSDGLIQYQHIGDAVEYEVDGKRFTRLSFWGEADDGDLLFWSDLEPPDFPITDSRTSSEAK